LWEAVLPGLATAKVLSQQGFHVEVLEQASRIGGVWADNYQGAGLQGPYPHFNIPDFPFPNTTPMFPKQPQILELLDSYVDTFDLKPLIRLNSEVKAVAQEEDGSWTVTLKGGDKKMLRFSGTQHRAILPSLCSSYTWLYLFFR
jgi:cation diffusion facilitator CzcD-associated flavoprotein CzcO